MNGYQVQFFSKVAKIWKQYSFCYNYSDALEKVEYLNSVDYDVRIITYRLERESIESFLVKEVI